LTAWWNRIVSLDKPSLQRAVEGDPLSRLIEEFGKALAEGIPLESLEHGIVEKYGPQSTAILEAVKVGLALKQAGMMCCDAAPALDHDSMLLGGLPKTFGRFEILERLGTGGNGIVFRVFDGNLKRDAALKIPRADVPWRPGGQLRFMNEARSAAALDHPNILPVYDTGIVNGVNYLLSAYCSGPTLAQWLIEQKKQSRPICPRLAAQWLLQIADGVDYSHSKGIVHRDLKPANIMLEPIHHRLDRKPEPPSSVASLCSVRKGNDSDHLVDSSDIAETLPLPRIAADPNAYRPRITDFGMSKIEENDEAATVSEAIVGTLAYMAPEQAQGVRHANAFAFDIYAMGAILFEMLTGRPPLVGQNQIDLLRRLGTEQPPPLSGLRRDVPRDLEAICMKCVEREPGRRYLSAYDLKNDLASYLAGEQVAAPRVHRTRLYWKPLAAVRLPIWVLCSVAVILAVMAMGFGRSYFAADAERKELSQSVASFKTDLTKEQHESKSQSTIAASLEQTLDHIYHSDMQRAQRIWRESSSLERDFPFAAADMKELLMRHVPTKGAIDRRGFEWYYLWRCCEPERFTKPPVRVGSFVGHRADVYAVEFTPDARRLITASADWTIRVWDVASRNLVRTLLGHGSEVNSISISGDGSLLASGSDDGTVRIWDIRSGQELTTLTGHQSAVVAVAFHLHWPLVFSGDDAGIVKVWNVDHKVEIHSFPAHSRRVQSLHRYPLEPTLGEGNSYKFLTSSEDDFAKLWDLENIPQSRLAPIKEFDKSCPLEFFRSAGRSPVIATLGYPNTDRSKVDFFRFENQNKFAVESVHRLQTGGFTVDDAEFYVAGRDAPIRSVDMATRKSTTLIGPREVWSLAFTRDGRYFATGEKDGGVTLWDCSSTARYSILSDHDRAGSEIDFSPNGRWMFVKNQRVLNAAQGKTMNYVVWDLASQPIRALEIQSDSLTAENPKSAVGSVAPDGRHLLLFGKSATEPWSCHVFELDSLRESANFSTVVHNEIRQVVINDNRVYFRTPVEGRLDVHAFDYHTEKRVSELNIPSGPSTSTLSSTGAVLAHAEGKQIAFYDVATGLRRNTIAAPFDGIDCLVFSPDAQQLAIGGHRGKIRVVDVHTGSVIADFQGDISCGIHAIGFAADGDRIVTGGGHCFVVDIWSIRHRRHLLSLRLPSQNRRVSGLSLSPDGKRVGATYEYMPYDHTSKSTEDIPLNVILWQITGDEAPPSDVATIHAP
jgi:eukaryotic-like serine/threonine-protein kinase